MRNETIKESYQRTADVFVFSKQLARKNHMKLICGKEIHRRLPKLTEKELQIIKQVIKELHVVNCIITKQSYEDSQKL